MNEFVKLKWRVDVTNEEFERKFLTNDDVSDLHVYKSFDHPLKRKAKKTIKLHLSGAKYVPGLQYYRQIKRRSVLNVIEKGHCLDAMKVIQSGKSQVLLTQKEKYSLKVYTERQQKIVEENQLFQEFVKNVWLKHREMKMGTKPGIYHFAWRNWKEKISRYLEYPQYYKQCDSLALSFDESEGSVDVQHVLQPLETGTLARYAHSTLKEACILKLNLLKQMGAQNLVNSKLPVSRDENIEKLLQTQNFDVVISSSSLKQIIDYTSTKTKWIIPVIIKEVEIKKGVMKKIVFVDQILPKVNPTVHDLNVHTYKRLLRLNFCQYEAFSYPTEETPIETEKEEEIEKTEDSSEEMDTSGDKPITEKQENKRVIHHNASYRLWSIKKTTTQNTLMKNQIREKDINLLVRCKLDGCEDTDQGILYPVIVRPKIEQQIQYGVNIPTKSELARDWTALFFRLYSVLYRARIYSAKNEVISIEKCTIQKINTEAFTHYEYKPIVGLGVLQKILSNLVGLECGSYLLQHLPKQEAFLSVLKQSDEAESAFDLHAECAEAGVDYSTRQKWLPIDVNYILPVHEEHRTIPGLFHGFDNNQKTDGVKVSKILCWLSVLLRKNLNIKHNTIPNIKHNTVPNIKHNTVPNIKQHNTKHKTNTIPNIKLTQYQT